MTYTEKEFELATRYMEGDCNETQFNYLIHTNGLDRERVEGLIDRMAYNLPLARAAKLMLMYIAFMFFFSLFCSIFHAL